MDIRSSVDLTSVKEFNGKSAFYIFALYVFAHFVTNIFFGITSTAFLNFSGISEPEIFNYRFPLSVTLVFFVTFIVVFEKVKPYFPGTIKSGALKPLGWTKSTPQWCWLASAAGAVISLFFVFVIGSIFPSTEEHVLGPMNTTMRLGGWVKFYLSLNIIFLSPLGEEVFYRGVLYYGFAKSFGKFFSAVLLTVLFVLMHVGEFGSDWVALSAIGGLSIGAVIVRELSDSIIPAILLHAVYNLVQVLLAYIY